MKAEACSSGLQSSDPRGRSLAGPPSTPGVRVAMHGRESWLGEAMSAARPGEGTRGGEIGVSPPELGSEAGALPIACRVPAPRPPFEALKATKCFNRQNPRRQALWSPRRTDGGTEASAGCVATPRLGSEAGGRGCRRVEDPRFAVWQQHPGARILPSRGPTRTAVSAPRSGTCVARCPLRRARNGGGRRLHTVQEKVSKPRKVIPLGSLITSYRSVEKQDIQPRAPLTPCK